jgi:hypothetical protein
MHGENLAMRTVESYALFFNTRIILWARQARDKRKLEKALVSRNLPGAGGKW